jgi:ribulose-phosphate 3-epimerase
MKIYPSLVSSDVLNIRATLEKLENLCDGYHIDVMDHHFVPNLTWGYVFINAIRKESNLSLHIHLMVDNPLEWIDNLAIDKKDVVFFHIESCKSNAEINCCIKKIREKKYGVGIVYNSETSVSEEGILEAVDYILIMSVLPGFSGQNFNGESLKKVDTLVEMRKIKNLDFKIFMDGGIDVNNIRNLVAHGVDGIGVASAIFGQGSYVDNIAELYRRIGA